MPTNAKSDGQSAHPKPGRASTTPSVAPKDSAASSNVPSFAVSALLEVPDAYKQQLRHAFDMFDEAGKGFIPSHEAVVALYALGYDVSRTELQQLLQEAGAKGSDTIDFNEFYNVLVLRMTKQENKGDSLRAFKQMDAADKGYIAAEDLRSIADSLAMNLTDDELAEMIQFARSVGYQSLAPGLSEFDAKDVLAVTEADYVRLMKRANLL